MMGTVEYLSLEGIRVVLETHSVQMIVVYRLTRGWYVCGRRPTVKFAMESSGSRK